MSNIRYKDMAEDVKDIIPDNESDARNSDKHISGRVLMAGAAVAGAIGGALANNDEVSARTDYIDRQANIPPVSDTISSEVLNNPSIEEVKSENILSTDFSINDTKNIIHTKSSEDGESDSEIIPPEDPRYLDFLREAVESEGQVLIESPSIPYEVVGEKGAKDKYGNYYENVINKINIAGNEIEVRTGGYFDEMTFLFDHEDDRVGKMLGIYWLEDKDFGKSFEASPYLEPLKGGNKIYIDSRDMGKASYGIITAIGTSFPRSVLPPEVYIDSDGNPRLMGSTPEGFIIKPSGFSGAGMGWIHSILFKAFIEPDGTQVLELLGVIDGSKVSILPEYLDSETARLDR